MVKHRHHKKSHKKCWLVVKMKRHKRAYTYGRFRKKGLAKKRARTLRKHHAKHIRVVHGLCHR